MAKQEKRYSEAEWLCITDLRKNWDAFCYADPFEGRDTFIERMEAAGFIDMRTATKRDVEATSFPEELGLFAGQPIWVLTKKGRAAMQEPSSVCSQNHPTGDVS